MLPSSSSTSKFFIFVVFKQNQKKNLLLIEKGEMDALAMTMEKNDLKGEYLFK